MDLDWDDEIKLTLGIAVIILLIASFVLLNRTMDLKYKIKQLETEVHAVGEDAALCIQSAYISNELSEVKQ